MVSDGVDQVSNVKEASSYVAKSSLSTQHVVEKSINMASEENQPKVLHESKNLRIAGKPEVSAHNTCKQDECHA